MYIVKIYYVLQNLFLSWCKYLCTYELRWNENIEISNNKFEFVFFEVESALICWLGILHYELMQTYVKMVFCYIEMSEQFLVTECFFNFLRFLISKNNYNSNLDLETFW